ncbi:MAG: hypothetical protein KAT79_04105, partial [candidate division Zixibacteria bacterium]|nr:hypothetical protein [candidate division Zixibacteria bacterium]
MKRTSFIIAFAALVLSFGLSYGQTPVAGAMSLNNVDGTFNWGATVGVGDTIMANTPITFNIRFHNDIGGAVIGHAMGFRVYSTDGAVWSACTNIPHLNPYPAPPTVVWIGWDMLWDNSFDINTYSNGYGTSGIGADTIGFSGSKKMSTGATDGFNEVVYQISTSVAASEADKHLCIDSSWYRPSNNWLWSTDLEVGAAGDRTPTWTGPHCFLIYDVPNLAPIISNCPVSPTGDHCDLMSIPLNATDPDDPPAYPLHWFLDDGPGTITEGGGDNLSATWAYTPTLGDVPTGAQVTLHVEDNLGMASADCIFTPNFTNDAPVFTGGCGLEIPASAGDLIPHTLTGDQVDCDPFTFSYISITPTPLAAVPSITGAGAISWQTDPLDYDPAGTLAQNEQLYTATFEITDGQASNTCTVNFLVVKGGKIKVSIDLDCDPEDFAFQGQHRLIDVVLEKTSGIDIGGFDILIAYDASALSFQSAIEGPDFYDAGCGWEYFTYRYGPSGNCGNACPSGMLRVVGIAETNNGDVHPTCAAPAPATMFSLDFLISNDRTLECSFIPISFFWMDCGDNSLSSFDGNTLYISAAVLTAMPDPITGQPTDIAATDDYPTYLGAQDVDCFVGDTLKVPVRTVDFVNGGICIPCADSIDARGDVNLNEIPYEIADAVVFSNYFVFGISAFHGNVEGQIAATDVNADG